MTRLIGSKMASGFAAGDNDIDDMIGYLILLKIAKKLAISVN
jgi:phosphate/sulfate permease